MQEWRNYLQVNKYYINKCAWRFKVLGFKMKVFILKIKPELFCILPAFKKKLIKKLI